MLFRNTMLLVLVVWLLVGWVRSHRDAATPDERERRAHMKRRLIERLALRGFKGRERDRLTEELWARIEPHITSTLTPFVSRHQRDHRPIINRHNTRILNDEIYPELMPFAQVYPQLEIPQQQAEPQEEIELQEEEEAIIVPDYGNIATVEMEASRDYLQKYLIRETLPDKMHERRHITESESETTTQRTSREERRREREEKRRKKEEKKKKRANKKNKKKKRNREFELSLRNQSIPIHDVDGEKFFDCCPSKLVIVQKNVGMPPDSNLAMEISESRRFFYERVCLEEYLHKECIFPARTLRKGVVTRCEQEYSYSQAFTRRYETTDHYQPGFIKLRSGCSCQVSLNSRKRKRRKR